MTATFSAAADTLTFAAGALNDVGVGDVVYIPPGLVSGLNNGDYYIASIDADGLTTKISATYGGPVVDITGSGSPILA